MMWKRKPKYQYYWIEESVEWPSDTESEDPDISYDPNTTVVTNDVADVLTQLEREAWDNLEISGGNQLFCYPADSHQDFVTGIYTSNQLVITARGPRHADKLMERYHANQ